VDPRAPELKRPHRPHFAWRPLVSLGFAVLFALAGLRLLFHVPKPMLAVSALLYLLCSVVFALRTRHHKLQPWRLGVLLLAWLSVCTILFGLAFHLDRSRWLYYEITGYDVTLSDEQFHLANASARSFLAYNRDFVPDPRDSGWIVLPAGDYVIDHTIIVPRKTKLTIEPGTTLHFEHGCSMISYSPVEARGTSAQPIVLRSRHRLRKWGVMGILNDGYSLFEHVRIENGRNARVNGVDFFGTLSLIGTNVEIRHCVFSSLEGKDGVYVRGGHVAIHDNLFQNIRKDGLDLDGGSGEVSHNRFIDCRDEGIDLSQTGDVDVFDNIILDARGGRIGSDRDLEFLKAKNSFGYTKDR
jgi:hypothetical protein